MDDTVWKPHVTVASLVERGKRFLLVRETICGNIVFNQPAGHLEAGETLLDAVIRETLEETRYPFKPEGLVSVYRFTPDDAPHKTYLRFLFHGSVGECDELPLDEGILGREWMSYQEVHDCEPQHRTPVVLQGINDYLGGMSFPLEVISRVYA